MREILGPDGEAVKEKRGCGESADGRDTLEVFLMEWEEVFRSLAKMRTMRAGRSDQKSESGRYYIEYIV